MVNRNSSSFARWCDSLCSLHRYCFFCSSLNGIPHLTIGFIMADPGTLLGAISLGISVLGGLLEYYKKWKSYDSDIASTCKLIKNVNGTFLHLRVSLNNSAEVVEVRKLQHIETCMKDCEEHILSLQKKLEKISLGDFVSVPTWHTWEVKGCGSRASRWSWSSS